MFAYNGDLLEVSREAYKTFNHKHRCDKMPSEMHIAYYSLTDVSILYAEQVSGNRHSLYISTVRYCPWCSAELDGDYSEEFEDEFSPSYEGGDPK